MSLRYSLFGIPATLDEFLDRTKKIEGQNQLNLGLWSKTVVFNDGENPSGYSIRYKIVVANNDLSRKYIAERDKINVAAMGGLHILLGTDPELVKMEWENKTERVRRFLSQIPSRAENLYKLLEERGFKVGYSEDDFSYLYHEIFEESNVS